MVLHVFNNESAFLDLGITSYTNAKIASHFAVFGKEESPKFLNDGQDVEYHKIGSDSYQQFLSAVESKGYKLIIFHGLLANNIQVATDLLKLGIQGIKTGWIIYGAEIPNAKLKIDHFHGPKTRKLYYRLKPIRYILPIVKAFEFLRKYNTKSIIKKMDYFVHFMPEEIEWVEGQMSVKKQHLWSIYIMLEDYIGPELYDRSVSNQKNIMIGNSSSFTSNHVELIDALKGRIPSDFKVHVPLNYGNKGYGSYVKNYGTAQLGSQFVPMMDRLPRDEYNEFLLSCPFVFMNHYRQQALGNILTALWMGAKIYLNEDISTYVYLKRLGFHIFSITKFFESEKLELEILGKAEVEHNRELMMQHFSRESVSAKMHESFKQFS